MAQPVRETLQQQYIRQLRLAVANILHMLMEYAGTSGKPPAATGAINGEIASADDAVNRLRDTPNIPNANAFRIAWPAFKAHWNNGNGSWTTAKADADRVNRLLNDTP
jgi:hypothetical protein